MFIKEEVRRSFWFNLLAVTLLGIVLYMLFFISLGYITAHGKELKVPDVTHKDMKAAVKVLKGMSFEVSVDSTYDPKLAPYTVLSQIPEVGSVVKGGRTVFITVNKKNPPMTPMPNLINLSFRIAEMQLKNNKLMLGDTSYQPDIAQGAVLKQMINGQEIRPGQMVPQGSKISLVIGDGLSNVLLDVPNVVGMPYPEATALIAGSGLTYTSIFVGPINDTVSAVVTKQSPRSVNELGVTNHIKEGDIVDITIMQSPTTDDMDTDQSAQGGKGNNKTP
ncbi:MAG: hypothetical protein BGO69_18330 [Bacteroidetes bacterium 46-16]|nr:MAG: hypothetical protein BGO69_18330 [Bacteroidetes bacterium 46-16]